jgi:hypothetical protein
MSATNRGHERLKDDAYETPDWLIEAILPFILPQKWPDPKQTFNILEPACGSGKIITAIERSSSPASLCIDGLDIRDVGVGRVGDFLKEVANPFYDLIITNPPYSLAKEFICHALDFRRNITSTVCFLLRLNFLGSQKRGEWLRDMTPSIYVTPRRPSFVAVKTKNSTDATEYAWFIWSNRKPTVVILDTEAERFKNRMNKCLI